MNSLNIVSRLTSTPPTTPPRSRTGSEPDNEVSVVEPLNNHTAKSEHGLNASTLVEKLGFVKREDGEDESAIHDSEDVIDEKTALLSGEPVTGPGATLPQRIVQAVFYGVKIVFTTITAPGRFVVACFYDDDGHFSAIMPLKNLKNLVYRRKRRAVYPANGASSEKAVLDEKLRGSRKSHRRSPSLDSNASTISGHSTGSDGEDSPARHTRSRTAASQQDDDAVPSKKTIRIKEHNSDALRKRKSLKPKKVANSDDVAAVASALKSPSSATVSGNGSKLTRYPRSPATPRPLVPRRQPSYSLSYSPDPPKKTLIIDLDETLIHSMAKGGRMSTGHMVEVRLGGTVSSSGLQIGPGVPILYYVHERPGCHEFLRKVCRWYQLVVFTASVQEYADPVIDWLERERKYFSGRYYRQHCTFRNGAYIKDLAQVEPDLSKVMILDNSPMSYIFHEDNAIPIEGWISDPTDNDLLHLIPLLEALQYVTDVRALLALRQGQAQQA